MKPKNLVNMGLLRAGNPDNCIKVLEGFEALGVDLMLCFMEMAAYPTRRRWNRSGCSARCDSAFQQALHHQSRHPRRRHGVAPRKARLGV